MFETNSIIHLNYDGNIEQHELWIKILRLAAKNTPVNTSNVEYIEEK